MDATVTAAVSSYRLQTVSIKRETRRRYVVRAVFFIFLLSLIEGPLRKWFAPSLAGPLTLLRDPFVLALYAYCFLQRFVLRSRISSLWLTIAAITSVVGLLQYMIAGLPVTGWALGVRTYWLYMPLAFIVAKTFIREDFHALLKLCLWVSLPYALLVAQQYKSPPFAFINLGVGGDEGSAVGLVSGIIRPFGLFTYTGPNVQFITFMIAVFVAFYVGGVSTRRRGLFLMVSGAAVGAMSVLTGSRSIYFLAAAIIGFTIAGMFIARPTWKNFRRGVVLLAFAGFAGLLFIYAFSDMLEAMAIRFERAERSEGSIWNRAFGGFFTWIDPLWTAPVLGMGIGAGAPGVARILGLPALIYGESDLQRNVNELGMFLGSAMVFLRFATAAWVIWLALRLAKRGEIMALPIAAFTFVPLLMGQITHSPLNAFLVWLSLGIVLAKPRWAIRQ